eukprot:sb/3474994/
MSGVWVVNRAHNIYHRIGTFGDKNTGGTKVSSAHLYYNLKLNGEVVVRCKAVIHTFGTSDGNLLIFSNETTPHSYQFSCHGNRDIHVEMGEKNHPAKPGGLSKKPLLEAHPMGALVLKYKSQPNPPLSLPI